MAFWVAHQSTNQPGDKIVKNLCTFLCQDTDQTPPFATHKQQLKGILSFQSAMKEERTQPHRNGKDKTVTETPSTEDTGKARLARRGAGLAFNQLSCRFRQNLFVVVPSMWQTMCGALLTAFESGRVSCFSLADYY